MRTLVLMLLTDLVIAGIGAALCWITFMLINGDYLLAAVYTAGYWCGTFINAAFATYRKWRLPDESGTIRRQGV